MRPGSATIHHLPSMVRTRVIAAGGRSSLEQVSWLSPYAAETIGQAAWRAGPGSRLEVIVPKSATAENVTAVEQLFAWLVEREITVTVRLGNEEE